MSVTQRMCIYLGAPEPAWIGRTEVPLYVSYGRLRRLKRHLPRSPQRGDWALDSRGFTELKQHGRWTISPVEYFEDVLRYGRKIGNLGWAAQQDYMCEDEILARTGLDVLTHLRLTVANYLIMEALWRRANEDRHDEVVWDGNPVLPVLQGASLADYHLCWDLFNAPDAATRTYVRELAGPDVPIHPVELMDMPVVGVGSVCTRQSEAEIGDIVTSLHERGHNGETGLPIHAFGVKTEGLFRYADALLSSDSQAWSAHARWNNIKMPGCAAGHQVCNYCLDYAATWHADLVAKLDAKTPS